MKDGRLDIDIYFKETDNKLSPNAHINEMFPTTYNHNFKDHILVLEAKHTLIKSF